MAVNYGLGGFTSAMSFGAVYASAATIITINEVGTFYLVEELTNISIGTTPSGDFSDTYHQFKLDDAKLYAEGEGVYLITYNITTSGASGDDLAVKLLKNGTSEIGGEQQVYSRGGSMFETGSNILVYLSESEYIGLAVANMTDTSNITIDNLNMNMVKLKYSGRVNSGGV